MTAKQNTVTIVYVQNTIVI